MYPHLHTHIFLSPPRPLWQNMPFVLCSLRECCGAGAAGALGTDMNKWTVLHSSMRRAAKHSKQEILHPLSKDLFKEAKAMASLKWSLHMLISMSTCTCPCIWCMHAQTCTVHDDARTRKTLITESEPCFQITAKQMDVTRDQCHREIMKRGLFEYEINIWFKHCLLLESGVLMHLETNTSLEPPAHFEPNA